MPAGRPTLYSEALADDLIAGIEQGTPLAQLCREMSIGLRTVYDWRDADPEFSARFARAREIGFDVIAQECVDIADETSNDTIRNEDGYDRANSEWISRSKLRVETRLKLLAKWDPKRYGDSTMIKHADADGEKIGLGDTDRATRAAALIQQAIERSDEPD